MVEKSMIISKLRAKNLGNPKVAAGFSEQDGAAGKIHWLGIIMGKASGTKPHKDPKDETIISHSLTGFFEGTPADTTKPKMRSGICWLPGGIHEMILEQVNSADEGAVVEFAFKIGTRLATNAAGYEYVTDPIGEAEQADPLADMRLRLSGQLTALPAPEASAAPAKPAGKARNRR